MRKRTRTLILIFALLALVAGNVLGATPVQRFSGNWARRQPPRLPHGMLVHQANLSQATPGTVLVNWVGVKLIIRNSNLVNCKIDKAWTVERCNVAQVVIPPPLTEKENLIEQRAMHIAERARLLVQIDKLNAQIGAMP